ncbi:hypothetical protein [Propionispora hippei]|uniref:hypothetical protein n=1 Tax=Propionispora hippei TaxID=209080 RepID=UPI001CB7488E|nr:hypothetical protein [Propionispora hippei]
MAVGDEQGPFNDFFAADNERANLLVDVRVGQRADDDFRADTRRIADGDADKWTHGENTPLLSDKRRRTGWRPLAV